LSPFLGRLTVVRVMSFEHSARKGCRMKRKIQRWKMNSL
jgi:hypothetical protein